MTIQTPEPTSRKLVRPRAGILAREIGGEMVLLDVDEATYYGLNEVGTRVWSLLVDGATLSEIEERLLVEFEVSREILETDLRGLLRDLAEHGLIDVILPDPAAG